MTFTLPPLEVCLDSCDSALAAEQGGASRVELCDNLIEGGTTPSLGMIRATHKALSIPIHVMVRPRGGDFCYSDSEVEAMLTDIEVAKQEGVAGVVFGALSPDGSVQQNITAALVKAAGGLATTFHRAFDMTLDPRKTLEELVELGLDRVLTSGQEPTVLEGLDLITELIALADDRILVLPGCGITPRNIVKIAQQSGAQELHVVGTQMAPSPMRFRNAQVYMGTELRSAEFSRSVTSAARIKDFLRAAQDASSG